ncbi:MAG: hypothetical protein ACK2UK_12210 [Candidatus Promineifilaceae bacterium]
MALKAENFYVEFSHGLYLDSHGKVVDELPREHSVTQLPLQINLPPDVAKQLKGLDLSDASSKLKELSPVFSALGIDKKVVNVVSASIGIVIGLASVYGTVGAVVNLLNVLGIFGGAPQDDTLKSLAKEVHNTYQLLKNEINDDLLLRVNKARSIVSTSSDFIEDYLQDENLTPDDWRDLKVTVKELHRVTDEMLGPNWQRNQFSLSSFGAKEAVSNANDWTDQYKYRWYPFTHWLDIVPFKAEDKGDQKNKKKCPEFTFDLSGADLKQFAADPTAPSKRWDYVPFIAIIMHGISVYLTGIKALDPAYRTTRTFDNELYCKAMYLQQFGDAIIKHILWTREWDANETTLWDYQLEEGWPVGAVNACTGDSAIAVHWREGIETEPLAAGIQTLDGMLRITNMGESLARARRKRELDWLTMVAASPAPQVLHMAALLRELATVPKESETVEVRTTAVAHREFLEKRERLTPQAIGCDPMPFTAAVHRVRRRVTVRATLQPERYQQSYAIPYRFWLESYPAGHDLVPILSVPPLDRVELKSEGGALTLKEATTFDWEVSSTKLAIDVSGLVQTSIGKLKKDVYVQLALQKPELYAPLTEPLDSSVLAFPDPDLPGVARNLGRQSITLDYLANREDGEVVFEFRNRPPDQSGQQGNFAGVFLVIEEQPRDSEQMIRTQIDISMVGEELHLPAAYFEYIELCETRARVILKEIEQDFQLKQEPIPPWDPQEMPFVHQWVQQILKEHPNVLEGDLLQEAKKLAKPLNL